MTIIETQMVNKVRVQILLELSSEIFKALLVSQIIQRIPRIDRYID